MSSRTRRLGAMLLVAGLALAGCRSTGTQDGAGGAAATDTAPGGTPAAGQGRVQANATVVRVVDGDTLVVRIDGDDERVRLIGIDTPESVKPDTPVECWGKEASDTTKELLPQGTPVRLERDEEPRDKYDRLLAYVRRASDGLLVNVELARLGAADALTIEPNTAYAPEIAAAVAEARRADRGLWGACGGNHQPAP